MHQHSATCVHTTHSNQSSPASKARLLTTALLLICTFAVIEFGAGLFTHSLALVADSGHLASDCLALILALLATWFAKKASDNHAAPGNGKIEVLAALVNGIGLIAIAFWIAWSAILRLYSPAVEILSLPMLATACVGLGVNSANIWLLHKDSHDDLNLKAAFLHIVADAASSVGVILAAIAVWAKHWLWADGVMGLLVAILIMISATPLIGQSLKLLMKNST
jgi:cobalt-zinc-cadmium efflux system protein